MCGIVGVAATKAWEPRPPLPAMRDALRHRGPDDAGEWWSADGRVGFGHRRLAILDLSAAGHQPMLSADGALALTFNGEIYNFAELRAELTERGVRFRGHSDTEVVLAAYQAWGLDCLDRLRGMFAFALYDLAERRLVLARDRAGEKPLFYRLAGGRLHFASELKALFADPALPRVLDPGALDAYLAFGYVPGSACLVDGMAKLAPGSVLTFDLESGRSSVNRYWALPAPPTAAASPDDLAAELEGLLATAVSEQLVADVPVGVLLSGGIDSSLVVALAARASRRPVRTFTISFPGHGAFDEAPYARLVADHFGTEHHELVAESASLDLLPALVHQYDEPIADSSMLPTFLVSRLIRPHCTVALGGDGGDELFGGYHLYQVGLAQDRVRRWLPSPVRHLIGRSAAQLPVGFRGRTYLQTVGLDPLEAVARSGLYLDAATRRRLSPLLAAARPDAPGERYRARAAAAVGGTLQRLTRADFASYLPDDILVKVDRASMLASLEVRAPFLDRRIVEFAFGRVPDRYRASVRHRKILPRLLAERVLPPTLDLSRKRGFSIPLAAWLRGEWGARITDALRAAPSALFAPAGVERLLEGQRRGLHNGQRLFALAFLALWREEHRIELPEVAA